MQRVVFCAVLALLCVVGARAEGESMEVDAEGNPLRKPIISYHFSSPDHVHALNKIRKVLAREPLSANSIRKSEEDDRTIQSLVPVRSDVTPADIKRHIKKENRMHRNAALARLRAKLAKKLGKRAGKLSKKALKKAGLRVTKSGKIVRKKSIFDDDDEKLALEKEIRLLEKLIGQGKKIWSALPEKEARLAALRKKIAAMAKGKAKAAAKKKLKALLALLDKVNDKIEALNNKLKQLLKRKAAIEKQIAKYRAIIAGKKSKKAKKSPKPAAKGKKAKKSKKSKKSRRVRKARKGKGKKARKGKGKKARKVRRSRKNRKARKARKSVRKARKSKKARKGKKARKANKSKKARKGKGKKARKAKKCKGKKCKKAKKHAKKF